MDEFLSCSQNLTTLYCNKNFTNRGSLNLSNLTYLDCNDNKNFTDKGLMTLSYLSDLHCGCNTNFTYWGLICLTNLERVSINEYSDI